MKLERLIKLFKLLKYLITILFVFFIWWLLAIILNSPILPTPLTVLKSFYHLREKIWIHLLASTIRIISGVGIALFLGCSLGLILGRNNVLDKLFAPLIYLGYPVPKIAFLPIVLLFLGLGNTSKIFLIALIVFFQIIVMTRDAAREIDEQLILSVKSLGAGKWQLLWQVVFPATLPTIFTATRISTGTAIAVLFFTETFATFNGLGYFIMDAWTRVNYQEMYAGIMVLSLLGLFFFLLIDFLERLACPWLFLEE